MIKSNEWTKAICGATNFPLNPDGLNVIVEQIQADALNAAIKACHEEHLENDQVTPRMDDDIAYDSAINDCVVAIISIRDAAMPNEKS